MQRKAFILALLTFICIPNGAFAENYLVNLKPLSPEFDSEFDKRLSPTLNILRENNAELVGFDQVGNPMIGRDDAFGQTLTGWAETNHKFIDSDVVKPAYRTRKLLLRYDGDAPENAAELASIGVYRHRHDAVAKLLTLEVLDGSINGDLVRAIEATMEFTYLATDVKLPITPAYRSEDNAQARQPLPACIPPFPVDDSHWCDQAGLRSVKPEQAWARAGGQKVIVAVIDSGVDYTHPEMRDRMWTDADGRHGWNFYEGNGETADVQWHGTHCAAIVGAVSNNGIGIAGVAPEVEIMALRWVNADGRGSSVHAAEAIRFAVDNGAKVINASWALPTHSPYVWDAIQFALDEDVFFVAAGGKNGANLDSRDLLGRYPAAYELKNIISVLGTGRQGELIDESGYGKHSVDLGAPGLSVLSAMRGGTYARQSGSSMAAAFVSGAVAIMLARDADQSFDDVRTALIDNSRPVPSLTGRCVAEGTLCLEFLGGGTARRCEP